MRQSPDPEDTSAIEARRISAERRVDPLSHIPGIVLYRFLTSNNRYRHPRRAIVRDAVSAAVLVFAGGAGLIAREKAMQSLNPESIYHMHIPNKLDRNASSFYQSAAYWVPAPGSTQNTIEQTTASGITLQDQGNTVFPGMDLYTINGRDTLTLSSTTNYVVKCRVATRGSGTEMAGIITQDVLQGAGGIIFCRYGDGRIALINGMDYNGQNTNYFLVPPVRMPSTYTPEVELRVLNYKGMLYGFVNGKNVLAYDQRLLVDPPVGSIGVISGDTERTMDAPDIFLSPVFAGTY